MVADNVVPSAAGSYNPFLGPLAQGDSLSSPVRGATQFYNNNNDSIIVGGTSNSLFVRGLTLTETTGLTGIGDGAAWDFAQFNNFIIATGPNNPPQYLENINTDTTWSPLPGDPPTALKCARVGDFLILGNETSTTSRLTWSSFNSPAGDWSPSRLTQAGNALLPVQFGAIQKIVGGRYALVFQDRGIIRLSYVGPPKVWLSEIVSEDRGTTAPNSVVDVGYQTYFLSQDGFYVTNGSEFRPIGNDRVNNFFFETVDETKINQVQGTVDWLNGAVIWAFNDTTGTVRGFDRLLVYSWRYDRWSTATVDVDWVVGSTLDGITLEDLDALFGTIEDIPVSLDSEQFLAGDRRLAAFIQNTSGDSEYNVFDGEPMEATWRTGEFEPASAQRVFINEVYPLIQTNQWDMSCSVAARDNRGALQVSPPRLAGAAGFCAVRSEGQRLGVQMVKPAGGEWTRAQGVQINFVPAGMR